MPDLDSAWKRLRNLPNVNGVSDELKPKIVGGEETDESAVRIYVEKKISKSALKDSQIIPDEVEGMPTDVVEIGEIRALKKKTDRFRPIKSAVSTGHPDVTAGSFGWFGERDGEALGISNNHVWANENKAEIGDPLLQPGSYDGGGPDDKFGELYDYVEIKFIGFECPYRDMFHSVYRALMGTETNRVDLALARINVEFEERIFTSQGTKHLIPEGKRDAEVGDSVQKSGRTSCWTKNAEVIDTSWRGQVQYSRGIAEFEKQILIEGKGFSAGGDSGSIILDMDGNVVALLFAGSKEYTMANRISEVEKLGDVEVMIP